ncbi:hypothetical protein G2W53_023602 [Senna tora]|uniref:Uncharacterized protein n=1 Tax=Senna tora TaxID=362788 RepID=A0A834TC26_9FABA|nr:hypothetical protein G2W53_023602 [Senna tora]
MRRVCWVFNASGFPRFNGSIRYSLLVSSVVSAGKGIGVLWVRVRGEWNSTTTCCGCSIINSPTVTAFSKSSTHPSQYTIFPLPFDLPNDIRFPITQASGTGSGFIKKQASALLGEIGNENVAGNAEIRRVLRSSSTGVMTWPGSSIMISADFTGTLIFRMFPEVSKSIAVLPLLIELPIKNNRLPIMYIALFWRRVPRVKIPNTTHLRHFEEGVRFGGLGAALPLIKAFVSRCDCGHVFARRLLQAPTSTARDERRRWSLEETMSEYMAAIASGNERFDAEMRNQKKSIWKRHRMA